MSMSDRTERRFLEHIVGKTTWPLPSVWVALCTAGPGDAGSGGGINEVANANNYARKSTSGADWNNASAGQIDNANAITFNQASGSWGTVTHFALVTSATWGEGEVLGWAAVTTQKTIGNGDTPSYAAGALVLTAD